MWLLFHSILSSVSVAPELLIFIIQFTKASGEKHRDSHSLSEIAGAKVAALEQESFPPI